MLIPFFQPLYSTVLNEKSNFQPRYITVPNVMSNSLLPSYTLLENRNLLYCCNTVQYKKTCEFFLLSTSLY